MRKESEESGDCGHEEVNGESEKYCCKDFRESEAQLNFSKSKANIVQYE